MDLVIFSQFADVVGSMRCYDDCCCLKKLGKSFRNLIGPPTPLQQPQVPHLAKLCVGQVFNRVFTKISRLSRAYFLRQVVQQCKTQIPTWLGSTVY